MRPKNATTLPQRCIFLCFTLEHAKTMRIHTVQYDYDMANHLVVSANRRQCNSPQAAADC